MSSSAADQVRADLREAYNAGDLTQIEYLAELRKLRQSGYSIVFNDVEQCSTSLHTSGEWP